MAKGSKLAKMAEKVGGDMKKTHLSREYCRHCGKETSRNMRHESGHREYDHERPESGKSATVGKVDFD